MGTYGTYHPTKAALVAELTRTETYPTRRRSIIAHRVIGMNLWSVVEYHDTTTGELLSRYIHLDLLYGGEQWSYKPVSEFMGPAEKNCPLRYLDLAKPGDRGETDTAFADEWREKVRQWHAFERGKKARHAEIASRLTPGRRIQLYQSAYVVQSAAGASTVIIRRVRDGQQFRLPASQWDDVSFESPEETQAA